MRAFDVWVECVTEHDLWAGLDVDSVRVVSARPPSTGPSSYLKPRGQVEWCQLVRKVD